MLRAGGLNVYDVLRHKKLLITRAAAAIEKAIEARLAGRASRASVDLHEVIQRPLVTEKSSIGREEAEPRDLRASIRAANKHEVRRAVEIALRRQGS